AAERANVRGATTAVAGSCPGGGTVPSFSYATRLHGLVSLQSSCGRNAAGRTSTNAEPVPLDVVVPVARFPAAELGCGSAVAQSSSDVGAVAHCTRITWLASPFVGVKPDHDATTTWLPRPEAGVTVSVRVGVPAPAAVPAV